jgi:hypothetical protein
VDCNGSITMSDGVLLVASTGTGDGALDYDGVFELTGGTLLAIGYTDMAMAPNSASQYTVFANLTSGVSAGEYVEISSGSASFVFESPISANSIVYSSPELKGGDTVTITAGGAYSGESYSGGTELAQVTLTDYVTVAGSAGSFGQGGMPGSFGQGGMPGSFNGQGNMPGGQGRYAGGRAYPAAEADKNIAALGESRSAAVWMEVQCLNV